MQGIPRLSVSIKVSSSRVTPILIASDKFERFLRARIFDGEHVLLSQVGLAEIQALNFSYSTLDSSWIGSTQTFLMLTMGIITGPLFDKGYGFVASVAEHGSQY